MRIDKISASLPLAVMPHSAAAKNIGCKNKINCTELPAYTAFLGSLNASSPKERAKLAVYNSQKAASELNRYVDRAETIDGVVRINIGSVCNKIERFNDNALTTPNDDYSGIKTKVFRNNEDKVTRMLEFQDGEVLRDTEVYSDNTVKITNRRDNTIVYANNKREPLSWIKAVRSGSENNVLSAKEMLFYDNNALRMYVKKGKKDTALRFFGDSRQDKAALIKNISDGGNYAMPEKCDYICTASRSKNDENANYSVKSYLEGVGSLSNGTPKIERVLFYSLSGLNPEGGDFTSVLDFEEPVSYHENMRSVLNNDYAPERDVLYGLSMKNTLKNGFVEI